MTPTRSGPVLGLEALTTLHHNKHMPLLRAPRELPEGIPSSVSGGLVWSGSHFASNQDYVLLLQPEDICELEVALVSFKGLPARAHFHRNQTDGQAGLALDGTLVSRENFPLPGLKSRLVELRCQLHAGRGFGSIRGLDPQRYSVEDLTVLHLGIQVHVADTFGRQDKKGNMLGACFLCFLALD